jgi:hypothetical protein
MTTQIAHVERVGHELVVCAWPEPPNGKRAGARYGVQGTFAVSGTETAVRTSPLGRESALLVTGVRVSLWP